MGTLTDLIVDVISRNLIRSKGERRIEGQTAAMLQALNEERTAQGKPPIVVEQREGWVTKVARGLATFFIVLLCVLIILLMIAAKVLVVP